MKIYDFPEKASFSDRLSPWIAEHEEEISKSLSDKFAYVYKPQIEYAKNDVMEKVGTIVLFGSVGIMVVTSFGVGLLAGIAFFNILSFLIKYCAKKCAVRIYEATTKHDVLQKCFEDILNRELAEAETDDQRKITCEFYRYAISKTQDIKLQYKK